MKLIFTGSSLVIAWCMKMHRTVKTSYVGALSDGTSFTIISQWLRAFCWRLSFTKSSHFKKSSWHFQYTWMPSTRMTQCDLWSIPLFAESCEMEHTVWVQGSPARIMKCPSPRTTEVAVMRINMASQRAKSVACDLVISKNIMNLKKNNWSSHYPLTWPTSPTNHPSHPKHFCPILFRFPPLWVAVVSGESGGSDPMRSVNELCNLSTVLNAFRRRWDELQKHLDFIQDVIASRFIELDVSPQHHQRS